MANKMFHKKKCNDNRPTDKLIKKIKSEENSS